jgi:Tfp pilus assembly protein PilF
VTGRKKRPTRARAAPPETQKADRSRAIAAAAALALALLVALVYAPVVGHEFVSLDDSLYYLTNPNLDGRLGLDDALGAFRFYAANWSPLTSLSIAIDNALYGVDPTGPLLTNAVLHAIASLLLFFALRALSLGTAVSAFAAAVFAVHPLHVESVAWAASRKDVLMGVGWNATLYAYARYREQPGAGRYAALLAAAAFALLAKPAAVTLPFALLLLDYWPLRRPRSEARAAVIEKLPIVALAALVSAMTVLAQTGVGAETSVRLPLGYRVLNAGLSYASYALDAFWPSGLAVFYPYHPDELTGAVAIASGLCVLVLSALALRIAAAKPHLFVGWFWFLGTLVPTIGLLQVGSQARADRYMYLPLIGLALALGCEAYELALRRPAWRRAVAAAGIAAVLALAITAHRQVGQWRDSKTLFAHAVAVTRDNAVARSALGNAYRERGDLARAEQEIAEALRIRPDSGDMRADFALVQLDQGRIGDARAQLERALASGADAAKVHTALGIASERAGDLPGAIASYREALRANPERIEAANNLAFLLATAPDPALRAPSEAIELAQRAARWKAFDPAVLDTLAAAYAAAGRHREAADTEARAREALPPGASPLRDEIERNLARYRSLAGS